MYCRTAEKSRRKHLLYIALVGSLALTGCQKKAIGPAPRYAVLRFENLSGDASLDWVGRAVSEVLSQSLAGALDGPVLNDQTLNRAAAGMGTAPAGRAKAELAGATRLITGYLERVHGQLRLSATDENMATHETIRMISAEAAQPMPAIQQLAHSFSPSARQYLTSNAEVLKLYSTALDEPPDRAVPQLRQAVSTDPQFGPAWLALIDCTAFAGNRSGALAIANEALVNKLDPTDQPAVRLQKANLENDKSGRLIALHDLSAANPDDLLLLRTLADSENGAGRFAQAAYDWNKLRRLAPYDRDAWNQFGYSLAWSGHYTAAIAAMKEYAARWKADPNPLDSTGDVEYMYGKFASAAAYYLKANEVNPQFLNGGDLYKAAWAQLRAGEKTKADATFARFTAARQKLGAASLPLFEGDWLYRTGREKESMALLRAAADSAQPAAASALWSQLVIEDLLAHDRSAAAKDSAIEATKPGSNISAIARFAALPSVSATEWRSRADSMIKGTGAEGVREFALGVALLLDGKRDAARPVWDRIAESGAGTDFFARAVDSKLKGEKAPFEIVPDAVNVNQLLAMEERL